MIYIKSQLICSDRKVHYALHFLYPSSLYSSLEKGQPYIFRVGSGQVNSGCCFYRVFELKICLLFMDRLFKLEEYNIVVKEFNNPLGALLIFNLMSRTGDKGT